MAFDGRDLVSTAARRDIQDIQHHAVVHDDAPIPDPQADRINADKRLYIVGLCTRIICIALNLADNPFGGLGRHSTEHFQSGFSVGDLFHVHIVAGSYYVVNRYTLLLDRWRFGFDGYYQALNIWSSVHGRNDSDNENV